MIAADAAGGHDHRRRFQREVTDDLARRALAALDTIWLEDRAADAVNRTIGHRQRVDAMAEPECQPAALRGFARPPLERLDDAGPGAPGDMKARYRIAVAHRVIAAALGPADHRKDTVSHRAQPVAFLAGCERNVGFRPAPWPVILVSIKSRAAHPVLQREFKTVLDAEPALLG